MLLLAFEVGRSDLAEHRDTINNGLKPDFTSSPTQACRRARRAEGCGRGDGYVRRGAAQRSCQLCLTWSWPLLTVSLFFSIAADLRDVAQMSWGESSFLHASQLSKQSTVFSPAWHV